MTCTLGFIIKGPTKMADNVNNKNDNKEMAMAVNIGPGL
jgi:hypothetical protein